MKKQFVKDIFGWGFFLWIIGYILGIIFFMVVPQSLIGWMIMPIGIVITLWVLFKKIKGQTLNYYFLLGIIWTLIAVLCDYFFLVKAFKVDGYYKLTVYVYYLLTFTLPFFAGFQKTKTQK